MPALRSFYSAAMRLTQPLLRAKLARRGRAEPGYLEAVDERFGRYAAPPPASGALWIHAVSLGETRAAAVLIQALRRERPALKFLLTHGTATGRAEGAALLGAGDAQAWLPWDTPDATRAFLSHFRPAAGVLMETEIWPNLVAACREAGVPLALANARLSAKSLADTRRVGIVERGLMRPAYAALAAVWAQTEADASRLAALGARVAGTFGNLKFDAEVDADALAQGRAWRAAVDRPVVMLAVSREGEEAAFLENLKRNRQSAQEKWTSTAIKNIAIEPGTSVRWLIVPRHPQRFDAVARLASDAGFTVSRRSDWIDGPPGAAEVWIGDSLGEMPRYYGLADIALLGGSFEPLGGQNLIEALACGCPVVMGPHTFNFAAAADGALEAGAAMRVPDMEEGVRIALQSLATPEWRDAVAKAGAAFAQAHRGAASRTVCALLPLLDRAAASDRVTAVG